MMPDQLLRIMIALIGLLAESVRLSGRSHLLCAQGAVYFQHLQPRDGIRYMHKLSRS